MEPTPAAGLASETLTHSDRTPTPRSARWLWPAIVAFAVAAFAWLIVYLWFTVPGPWFSSAPTQRFSGPQMTITRGSGHTDGIHFIIASTDPTGLAIVTIDTPNLSAADYRRIRWRVQAVDTETSLATVWRSDASPGKINNVALEAYGDLEYVARPQPPDWSGRIEGVALAVRGTLRQPIFIDAVTIEPLDARNVIADRLRDWFAFKHWSGLSINTAIGGPLEQPIWLPLAAVTVALSAIIAFLVWSRERITRQGRSLAVVLIVAATWVALDARWLWSRMQQAQATAATFSGKSVRERHIADVDGYVFAFAEQVNARLPKSPSRIYVAADDHYFGGRLAFHLYPHNVYMNHDTGALPSPDRLKPGEYIVVFRRRGVVYDPASRMLSWDQQPPIPAEVLIAHQGNAAFRLR